MKNQLIWAALSVVCACAQAPPLACNLKAFTAEERADWRKQLDHVMASVSAAKEISDGYSFSVDVRKASLVDVARWVELERKCCPFLVFEIGMQGQHGSAWLNLRGAKGVKEFIAEDFRPIFERLRHR
jgi:hypothetical protein